MRSLAGGRGIALLALGAGGVLLLRPRLLKGVLGVVPIGALLRMAAVRYFGKRF